VTGPHAGLDRYGRFDHRYYRCERCGLESTDPALLRGCPSCRDPTGFAMLEGRASPSGGWRAVYGATGAPTSVEGDAPTCSECGEAWPRVR
jgi:hypothetical protein